jgi:hypothetical protein
MRRIIRGIKNELWSLICILLTGISIELLAQWFPIWLAIAISAGIWAIVSILLWLRRKDRENKP